MIREGLAGLSFEDECVCSGRFKYDPTNENQVFSSWDDKPEFPVPEGELIPASSDLFTYEGRSGPSALVNNIQRKRDYRAAVAKLQSS